MGAHRVVPGADWLEQLSPNDEPRHAMMVTGALIFGSLLARDLNAIAPLITMFFLVTYAMICAAVLIEQSLDLVSFRPRLRFPLWVSFLGLAGSLLAMFIINPVVSLVSLVVTLGVYAVLARRHLDAPFEDVRSGLFVAVAEWAAEKVTELPTMQERAWRPNLLVPVTQSTDLRGEFLTLQNLTEPQGSVKIVGLSPNGAPEMLDRRLGTLTDAFQERDIFASATVIDAGGFAEGLRAGMQALRGAFFKPNIVFLRMPGSGDQEVDYQRVIAEADREDVGTLLYAPHPRAALGQRQTINVWIRNRSPDWRISMEIGNLDLALLTGYKLSKNWGAKMRLITAVTDAGQREKAQDFLEKLIDLGRLPSATAVAGTEPFESYVQTAPQADLNIFGLQPEPDFDIIRRRVDQTDSTCMFVRDSGRESALA